MLPCYELRPVCLVSIFISYFLFWLQKDHNIGKELQCKLASSVLHQKRGWAWQIEVKYCCLAMLFPRPYFNVWNGSFSLTFSDFAFKPWSSYTYTVLVILLIMPLIILFMVPCNYNSLFYFFFWRGRAKSKATLL